MSCPDVASEKRTRLIYKVLVLGCSPTLQAGYLNRASGTSLAYQLYMVLGIGIGVSRIASDSGDIALQLWLIPETERYPGMAKGLMRGSRSSVIVLRESEFDGLPRFLQRLSPEYYDSLMMVLVGSSMTTEDAASTMRSVLGVTPETHRADSVLQSLEMLAGMLAKQQEAGSHPPLLVLLDDIACPEFATLPEQHVLALNNDEEIAEIRQLGFSLGIKATQSECIIAFRDGVARLDLRTGSVFFDSFVCEHCMRECKRASQICIVGLDKGWSSDRIGSRALLTMAKLNALVRRDLPSDVEAQISRASRCSNSRPQDASCRFNAWERRTLLEEAGARVRDGRLPVSAYNMLKSKLHRGDARSDQWEECG